MADDPRVELLVAAGWKEDWSVRSVMAFEAAGLVVAVDGGGGLESRAAAWDRGYEAASSNAQIAAETYDWNNPQKPVTANPYRSGK